ncbi:MAG: antitoxin Xre/MbcA/ParS toxin-binding domain-containing protein [Acidithiobacillus ferriphilus]
MNQGVTVQDQHQDRSALARMVMRAFELWGIGNEDQLSLLGLATDNRAALSRYRKGAPLAASRDLLERAGHLLAIHKNLRILFPEDRDLAYAWMTQRNRAFDNHTPVEVIRESGFVGLLMVRAYLDRARGA